MSTASSRRCLAQVSIRRSSACSPRPTRSRVSPQRRTTTISPSSRAQASQRGASIDSRALRRRARAVFALLPLFLPHAILACAQLPFPLEPALCRDAILCHGDRRLSSRAVHPQVAHLWPPIHRHGPELRWYAFT